MERLELKASDELEEHYLGFYGKEECKFSHILNQSFLEFISLGLFYERRFSEIVSVKIFYRYFLKHSKKNSQNRFW